MGDEYVSRTEALRLLGVSHWKLTQLLQAGALTAYELPTDKRRKVFRRVDLEALRQPKPRAIQGRARPT